MYQIYFIFVIIMYILPMIFILFEPEDPLDDPVETIIKEYDNNDTNYYAINIPTKLCAELNGGKYTFYTDCILKRKDNYEYIIDKFSLEAHIVDNIKKKRYIGYKSNDNKYDIEIYTGY